MTDFTVNVLTARVGRTCLFYVGQAGFLIRSASGSLMGIDLYLSDCVERYEGHIGYHRLLPKILPPGDLILDAVIATHSHKDHFDDDAIPVLMANGHTELYASAGCRQEARRLHLGDKGIIYVKPGDHHETAGFAFDFINCDHGAGAPDAVGVILTVDGKRLLFTGDTSLRLDRLEEYLSCGPIDVMLAPINGAYGNMNEAECVELALALKPGFTVPCHYGMFASHGGNPGLFHEIMSAGYPGLSVRLMAQGEKLEL